MEYVFLWLLGAAFVAWLAAQRGRSAGLWFVIAALASPAVGLLALLLASNRSTTKVSPLTHVRCPECRELVLKEARKCKHCGCLLVPQAD